MESFFYNGFVIFLYCVQCPENAFIIIIIFRMIRVRLHDLRNIGIRRPVIQSWKKNTSYNNISKVVGYRPEAT